MGFDEVYLTHIAVQEEEEEEEEEDESAELTEQLAALRRLQKEAGVG